MAIRRLIMAWVGGLKTGESTLPITKKLLPINNGPSSLLSIFPGSGSWSKNWKRSKNRCLFWAMLCKLFLLLTMPKPTMKKLTFPAKLKAKWKFILTVPEPMLMRPKPLKAGKNLIVVELRAQGEKKTWDYKVLRKAKIVVAEEEKIDQQIKAAVIPEVKARLIEEKKVIEQTKEKVEVLVTLGVVEVKPKEEFVLEDRITRGELATWIVKAAGFDLPEVKKDVYVDVPKDHVLAPYIKVVSNLELLEPFPDGTFRPEAFVSKKEGEEIFRNFGIEQ